MADAAEIRLLGAAWARVAASPGTSPTERQRADIRQRSLIAELATAVRVSEWTAARLLGEAHDLCDRFAEAVDALESGVVSRQHVAVIHDEGGAIHDPDARAAYVTAVLDRATGLTPGRLKPVARVLADRYVERTLEERHHEAAEGRRVEVCDLPDGMGQLVFYGPATLVHGIDDRLTQQARRIVDARATVTFGEDAGQAVSEEPGDARTFAQVRADLLSDMLLTGSPSLELGAGLASIRGTVQVTVPVLRMTGATNEPAVLAGYGPIDADTARTLAAGAPGWERVLTCPTSGVPVAVDRYRPGKALKRFLKARDEGCRFPGCTRPFWRTDLDHTVAAADGGPTSDSNLAHLCRRHHTLKHATPWSVDQIGAGVLVWTSPTGRKHTDMPRPAVRFEPDPELIARRTAFDEPWRCNRDEDDPDRPGF